MKRFQVYRRDMSKAPHNEYQKNPANQVQFEGVEFEDGTVVIQWQTAARSVAIWKNMDDMLKIHGHPEYGSELWWMDEEHDMWSY